jgi:hypothetical protein
MKILLLKVLLHRRARDEGFTLPMVIAIGLIMILLGAVSITTANEENITAISQNSKSDALAIAEIGVARYRELLDSNRVLSVYDSNQWSTATEVCNSNIANFLPGVSNTITLREDSQELNNDGDSTDSFNIGSYSLVSYDYTNANGVFDQTSDAANNNARGILTVRGVAPNNAGEAQIEVEIPIRINPGDMTNLAPALWIGDNTITTADLGSLNLGLGTGNVVIRDKAVAATRNGCRNFTEDPDTDGAPRLATGTRPVVSDNRDLPSIQKIVTDVANARTALSVSTGSSINNLPTISAGQIIFGSTADAPYNPDITTGFIVPNLSTGERGSCADIKSCRYYYDPPTSATTFPADTDLLTDGIAKTTLLLNQPLFISATTRDIQVGSTNTFGGSNAFEIYVNGTGNDITINADSGRTINIKAFIHAPNSKLTITGTGTVNITGSVWVNDFENTTATVNISPDNIKTSATAVDRAYKFYSTTTRRTPRPLTGSPTNWKTEQVN